jgi:hypothetical protein
VSALTSNPQDYRESLGHMADLTLASFAYLRVPLFIAAVAFLIGALGTLFLKGQRAFLAAAVMMIVFFHAARVAMISFDPLLSSKPLADAFLKAPAGTLVAQGHFYEFSSVFFYTGREGLLSTDRRVNLEYGSFAPGAPPSFIEDNDLADLWNADKRCYLFVDGVRLAKYQALLSGARMYPVARSGGKFLFTNEPL